MASPHDGGCCCATRATANATARSSCSRHGMAHRTNPRVYPHHRHRPADVYARAAGVLTGTARVALEAHERTAAECAGRITGGSCDKSPANESDRRSRPARRSGLREAELNSPSRRPCRATAQQFRLLARRRGGTKRQPANERKTTKRARRHPLSSCLYVARQTAKPSPRSPTSSASARRIAGQYRSRSSTCSRPRSCRGTNPCPRSCAGCPTDQKDYRRSFHETRVLVGLDGKPQATFLRRANRSDQSKSWNSCRCANNRHILSSVIGAPALHAGDREHPQNSEHLHGHMIWESRGLSSAGACRRRADHLPP